MFLKMRVKRWQAAAKSYAKGEMDAQMFVDRMKDQILYYSTPFGEDEDGNSQFYVLSKSKTETKYFPAFLTKESCARFFDSLGRDGFMILEGRFGDFLAALDSGPVLAELGTVIEPFSAEAVDIPPWIRAGE